MTALGLTINRVLVHCTTDREFKRTTFQPFLNEKKVMMGSVYVLNIEAAPYTLI